jgi:uncharacterized protein (DUF433 family)
MESRIEINSEICNGRPIIAGTRITVETVLSYLSAGDTVEDIIVAHPVLTRDDILSSIDYARRLSAARSTVSLSS